MSKKEKSNSGNDLNAGELGSELPAANFPRENMTASPEDEKQPAEPLQKMKMKTIISGAEFWRFSPDDKGETDGEIFEGYFVTPQIREKDGKGENQQAGSVIGYVFEQAETGERYIIGKSHSIEKALTQSQFVTDKLMRFQYLGQGKNSNGQKFNRFEIAIEE